MKPSDRGCPYQTAGVFYQLCFSPHVHDGEDRRRRCCDGDADGRASERCYGQSNSSAFAFPSTGGAPEDSGVAAWLYGLLALGGVLLAGSGLSFALARKR